VPDPADVIEVALAGGDDARRRLRERGIDPARCEHLVVALENAIAGHLAAAELGVAVEPRRKHLEAVKRLLDEAPLLNRPPEPPRQFPSRRLYFELADARRVRGAAPDG
jgi:hypothetical protein